MQGIPTARGAGQWSATQVPRVLERLGRFSYAPALRRLKERRFWRGAVEALGGNPWELLYSHSYSRLTSASCQPTPPTDAVLVAIKHRRVHASSTAGALALAYGMNALPGLAPVHPAAMGSSGVPVNEPVSKRRRIGSSPLARRGPEPCSRAPTRARPTSPGDRGATGGRENEPAGHCGRSQRTRHFHGARRWQVVCGAGGAGPSAWVGADTSPCAP